MASIEVNIHHAEITRATTLTTLGRTFGLVTFSTGDAGATVFCHDADEARRYLQAFADVVAAMEAAGIPAEVSA